MNAILYTPGAKYWAMTERGTRALQRSKDELAIGPSRMKATTGQLEIEVDEWTVPLPSRMRGSIVVRLCTEFSNTYALDTHGRHGWRPIAPCASVDVRFENPRLSWRGPAYVDMNFGAEPLEAGFRYWTWSREDAPDRTRILYDVEQRDGSVRGLALEYRRDGSVDHIQAAPVQHLPRTAWHVRRRTRSPADEPATVMRTLEDTPFYSRSILGVESGDAKRKALHESVDLDRFASRWVQALLPFKMPRRAG